MGVLSALDRVAAGERDVVKRVRGRRVGLLAHPASVDRRLRHARTVLEGAGARVVALFGPEHGYAGHAQDMVAVDDRGPRDAEPRVYSLYGDAFEDLSPRPEWLDGLDAVVVDLQDVGSRYYTYVWTAALMLRACAASGVPCVVLDRPNPLGGEVLEGAPQRPGYRSFVGLHDVPVRHGMTLAELLRLVAVREGLAPAALEVVPMLGWSRDQDFAQTGLPWVLPSPNMPTLDTARVYPGGCLLEGTNLSEGRGTTRPFEIWGAPFVDGEALARAVQAPGVTLRPLTFEPTFHKHAGAPCGGVQVHITDPGQVRSFELYLRLIAAVARRWPQQFAWRTETYEFVSDRPAIDLLYGGPEFREAVDTGQGLDEALASHARPCDDFRAARRSVLLY